MAQKKFGTFAGVFTPSILTILGVIMYLRLGWVVGQAGLVGTIVIILIAHIISISTGLSISSIATDKKVKAGGIYYILSRSLGLPIGGAIGLALFVGMGFSVSLYVIGFCESFNPIIGQGTGVNDLRFVGTLVLLGVAIIAYISTSFALKTQFLVLAAIGLSLIAIFFGTQDFVPADVVMFASKDSIPMEAVFAVFFPAVTGFTAGVAMSGDLKNPKKAIPVGTMLAIGFGFVIYIALSIFLALTVSSDVLKNDTGILLKIAFFSPLVIAGIWGATISSALGSILGAPRLLQALAADRIMPKFMGKGSGKDNEPRIALVATFALAEVGILIGELDVIAGLVSMFFLTAYGFINLACALENWASSDFRPSFKIPKTISIIGFIVAFAVMFKLDMLSMIGSFIVMGGIFLLLKRREIKVSSGNIWDGVWSSVVLKGLNKLADSKTDERNWRPNILLFSGGTEQRPHLAEIGKSLIGKLGTITNFDLIENHSSKALFSKQEQMLKSEHKNFEGVFTRKHECRDIYEGIESISSIYGFSGMEPNTVLMGWARNTDNPKRFNRLLNVINDLDYNLLLLDYDTRYGYGNYSSIDIWIDKPGNYPSLAIAIIKFLLHSESWADATVRLIVTINDNSKIDLIYKNLLQILDDNRIEGIVKVINNTIEQKSLHDIILIESSETDLIILGLPTAQLVQDEMYINNINDLCAKLGTILLIDASSYFDDLPIDINFNIKSKTIKRPEIIETKEALRSNLPPIKLPDDSLLAQSVIEFNKKLESIEETLFNDYILHIFNSQKKLLDDIGDITNKNFDNIVQYSLNESPIRILDRTKSSRTELLFQANKIFSLFLSKSLPEHKDLLISSSEYIIAEIEKINKQIPDFLPILINKSKFNKNSRDTNKLKIFKFRKRLTRLFSKKDIEIKVKIGKISEYYLHEMKREIFMKFLTNFALNSYKDIFAVQQAVKTINDGFLKIEKAIINQNYSLELVKSEIDNSRNQMEELRSIALYDFENYSTSFLKDIRANIQEFSSVIDRIDANKIIDKNYKTTNKTIKFDSKIREIPQLWLSNINLIANIAKIDIITLNFSNRISLIFNKVINDLLKTIDVTFENYLDTLLAYIETEQTEKDFKQKISNKLSKQNIGDYDFTSIINNSSKDITSIIASVSESIDVLDDVSLKNIEKNQFEEVEIITISLQRLVKYYVDTELMGPINEHLHEIDIALQLIKNKILNQYRSINFLELQIANTNKIDIEEFKKQYRSLLQSTKKIIFDEREKILEIKGQLQSFIELKIKNLDEKLNTNMIIRSSGSLKKYMIKQETHRAFSIFEVVNKKVINKIKTSIVWLWFRRSEAVIFANRIQESEKYVSIVNRFQSFARALTPDNKVLDKLPFYYKQLFIGKQIIINDFWIERKQELIIAKQSYNKFKSGKSGGLMIIGASNSGKSSFSSFLANELAKNKQYYIINSPDDGSIDIMDIKKQFSDVLHSNGEFDEIMDGVPENSIFIINDLELWWERSINGFAALEFILSTIAKYGNRFFFILNMNTYSYNFINKIKPIENNFLDIIQLTPFNAQELQDLVLRRHKSSNLNFHYLKKNEEKMTDLQYAKLFNIYFEYTKGNPGATIHNWINNIQEVRNNGEILIGLPNKLDIEIFDDMNPLWGILLIQFILHKRLSFEKLKRIFDDYDKIEIENNIAELLQADIIVKNQNGVMKINPYLQSYIENKLKTMEMI